MTARLAIVAVLATATTSTARAEPLRLRSNAFAQSQADTPVGLLALRADGDLVKWMTAEAVVWVGAGDEAEADAMVVSVVMKDPKHRGEVQLGRFVVVPGAVRPIHLDGARVHGRLPWKSSVEVFGGVPVVPELGAQGYDWVVGSRASRQLGEWGSVGAAWMQRRTQGRLDDQEVGFDIGAMPLKWLDFGGRVAYDLIDPGVSDAGISVAARRGAWRYELFGSHRSPSRILPATSLFTVLGDVATQKVGASTRWRAAPRLDLLATAAVRLYDDTAGAELLGRGVLRLDDKGKRALTVELRREDGPEMGWTGARAGLRLPLNAAWHVSSEVELVVPDEADGRGTVWPWALGAVSWRFADSWTAAAAMEVSSSPQYTYRVDGIARLTRDWGAL